MNRIKQFLGEHKAAIFLAILTSVIVASPQVFFRIDHKADGIYQGIELLPDSPWSARVTEVQNGHPNFGAIYYKDGKDLPYLFQSLGSRAVAFMGTAFSLDINNTLLLSRVILSFAVFLLIYCFVFLLSRDKLVSLSSAAALLLADSMMNFYGISQLLQGKGISPDDFLRISRPVNPAMIYVLFFGFLIVFWLFYKRRNWLYGILSAVLLGLNFYNYFYTWTYLYAFGGILVLTLLIRKNWKEAARIGSVFLGALLVAIPYGMNVYRASLHPAYEEASMRFGMIETHAPLFVGFGVIGALIIFLLWFPREDREKYFFGLALLLTPFITQNQQILTGKILQEAHYHWFFNKPMAVMFVLIIIFNLLSRLEWSFYKKLLSSLIILGSVGVAIYTQYQSYYFGTNDGGQIAIERQRYGLVVKWLNKNTEKEEVVLANNETSHITAIYTPLNLFYHRAAMYSLAATKERLLEVVFTFYRLRGVGEKDAREVFFAEGWNFSANIYGMHYRQLLGAYALIPDEKIEEILGLYKKTLSVSTSDWLEQVMDKYEVKYIVWDKKNDPLWNLDQYSYLVKAADFSEHNLAIYAFRP